jgi:hypothetical protein
MPFNVGSGFPKNYVVTEQLTDLICVVVVVYDRPGHVSAEGTVAVLGYFHRSIVFVR